MYNLHAEMNDFYKKDICLSEEKRDELARFRNINLERLNKGLALIGEDDEMVYGEPDDRCDQGSFAMHTLNQSPSGEYDIDVAIIFKKDDLPADPCDTRDHIVRAFSRVGVTFKKPPERRTNAVTIWYAEGYHVDFAVYRLALDDCGAELTEHAGSEWKPRNPTAITEWFEQSVADHAPSSALGATVEADQLRKVVRLLKAFARSRADWDLPGGMIISKLVDECFEADLERDDRSLYNTIQSIYNRLLLNLEVSDPIYADQLLTDKNRHQRQVERLRVELEEALDQLSVLWNADCTRRQAMDAWYWFFNHDFWLDDGGSGDDVQKAVTPYSVGRSIRESPSFA